MQSTDFWLDSNNTQSIYHAQHNTDPENMNNKNQGNSVAVVTGGARGIGLGCAKALSTKGFDIVLIDVLEEDLERERNKKWSIVRKLRLVEMEGYEIDMILDDNEAIPLHDKIERIKEGFTV